jgi:pimeloyl-ACP methyl ester carboxylesterase
MDVIRTQGRGPLKVIWLHGWFGSADGWGPVTDCLDGEVFTHAFMDYRGYGARRLVPGDHSMAEIANDALALADQLGWTEFSLVGHSMGGMAVQRVLAQAPQRVRKLVGITPVPASGLPFDDADWAFFRSAALSLDARRGIIDMTTGKRLSGVWLEQMVQHSRANSTSEAFSAYLVAWAKTNFESSVRGRPLPVLVFVGQHDPAITEDLVRATWLTTYPQAKLQVMDNAGHYPMFETPVALATAVEHFLAA